MEFLPIELWNHTCTFLGPSDLASLALVSSSYLSSARYQLYTSLVLRSDSPSVRSTFKLIKSTPALARRVHSLTIDTDTKWSQKYLRAGNTWLDLDIFVHMERLQRLRVRRLPCVVSDDAKASEFVDILSRVYSNCKSLTEVNLSGFWWPQLPTEWLLPEGIAQAKQHPKLEKIVYSARYSSGISWTFLRSSLFTPSSSITYLDFFIGNNATHLFVLPLFSFPSLVTLIFRSASQAGMSPIATFLVSHPSIQHLSLIDMDNHLPPLDKLFINMLPCLQTIYAAPILLHRLSLKCESLRHIRALVLEHTDMTVPNFVENTAMLVTSVGGFPELRHCSVPGIISSARTAEIVRIIAAESMQLTCWTGGFYYRHVKQLRILAEALAAFPVLARLDICEWTYPTSPPTVEQLDALTYIARRCPTLQKMSLYMTHLPSSEILTVYRVVGRNNGGIAQLKETYRCAEGGPYIKERRRIDYMTTEWDSETMLE
ncbi:hypothetical protein BDN70DRAFT_924031, partial [Pholiota conissans]